MFRTAAKHVHMYLLNLNIWRALNKKAVGLPMCFNYMVIGHSM